MAVVGTDFHGNFSKVERFLAYKPDDLHVFCGDILDSFDKDGYEQIKCLNTLFNSDSIFIVGNHEIHYLDERPFGCSGFNYKFAEAFNLELERHINSLYIAYYVDGYILTHAGLCKDMELDDNPENEVDQLNKLWYDYIDNRKESKVVKLSSIFNISHTRGGNSKYAGPLWFDHIRDYGISDRYNQISGHTASKKVITYKFDNGNEFICLNTTDTSDDLWIFDTSIKEVVKLEINN